MRTIQACVSLAGNGQYFLVSDNHNMDMDYLRVCVSVRMSVTPYSE